jgi:branched-chain amino acid transport system ATP-binding protein
LLNILGLLDRPTAGEYAFVGQPLHGLSEAKLTELRRHSLSFVFQSFNLIDELTVYENVLLPTLIARKVNKPWVKEVLKRVRLWNRRAHYPSELSGGEQQMLAVARALLLKPKLLLLDDPSFGLAPLIVQDIFGILRRIREESGVGILLVEQNANLALDLADHAYLLETGRIVMSGPAAEIRQDEAIRRSYLGY